MEKRRGEEWRSVEFFEVWNWIEESAATVVSWRRSHWVPTILYLGFKFWAEAHPWWASWQNNILRKASWKIIQKNCGSFFSDFSIFQPCSSKMAVHGFHRTKFSDNILSFNSLLFKFTYYLFSLISSSILSYSPMFSFFSNTTYCIVLQNKVLLNTIFLDTYQ